MYCKVIFEYHIFTFNQVKVNTECKYQKYFRFYIQLDILIYKNT